MIKEKKGKCQKKAEPNNPDKSFSAKPKPRGKFVSRYMIELFAIIDKSCFIVKVSICFGFLFYFPDSNWSVQSHSLWNVKKFIHESFVLN